MKKSIVAIVGFFVAPLIPAVIFVLLNPKGVGQDVISRLGLLPIFYFFAALATTVFGVPTFFLLHSFRLIRWWTSLGAGTIIGALIAVVLRLPSPIHIHDFALMVPVGAASAFGFWLIWRQAR